MTCEQVIYEYRQVCLIEKERLGDAQKDGPDTYQDEGYEQELRELGVTPEMLKQMRGNNA